MNDYYGVLINIYFIVDRKKNIIFINFLMDTLFLYYLNMLLLSQIYNSDGFIWVCYFQV